MELIVLLTPEFHTLATQECATPEQMQHKFLPREAGLLSYGGLATFFGGLEAKIGAPHPRVHDPMDTNHTDAGDSHDQFTTKSFGVTTTSAIEWAFVAEPESRRADEWTIEAKLLITRSEKGKQAGFKSAFLGEHVEIVASERQRQRRQPLSLGALLERVDKREQQLEELKQPRLTIEEAIGARLYTGPLFVKYNAVLRGLDSSVLFLRGEMIRLCCPTANAEAYVAAVDAAKVQTLAFEERTRMTADDKATVSEAPRQGKEEALRHCNRYTTTLHAINSAIVKLGKLTVAEKVFRGVHDFVLPKEFWEANQYRVCAGIDGTFMSTTRDRDMALSYARGQGGVGFVLEIQQGMIDRGADASFLSHYPFECEILFAPLIGLEVQGIRVYGSVLVIETKLSVNLISLTIEQVIGKRKKMLQDMVSGLTAELRQALEAEGVATKEGIRMVEVWLQTAIETDALHHPIEWYNEDEQLSLSLQSMLEARRQLRVSGMRLKAELLQRAAEEMRPWGFGAAWLKVAGADGSQLKAAGFDARALRAASFDASALKAAGYDARALKAAGFGAIVLKAASFDASALRAAGYDARALKAAGFGASVLKAAGFDASALKAAGFDASVLKAAYFDALVPRAVGFDASALKAAGFGARDLEAAGFGASALKEAGFDSEEVRSGFGIPDDAAAAKAAGFDASVLRAAGLDASALRAAGFNASVLRAAGFDASTLKAVGFDASALKAAGFGARVLRAVGFGASELKAVGFDASTLKAEGFGARVLRAAGFDASALKAAGFHAIALKAAGCDSEEVRSAYGIPDDAAAAKAAHFDASTLRAEGFDASVLRAVGFNASVLRAVGFDASALKALGFDATALKATGFDASELKAVGFGEAFVSHI